MSSIVLELQQEIIKADCDILNVLRKAHLIATKLKLQDFDSWIQLELKGYYHKKNEEIPDYRKVKGILKAFNPYNGWITVQCQDNKTERMICEQKMWQSIDELQELHHQASGNSVVLEFSAETTETISSMTDIPFHTQYALHISPHLLKRIIEQVKNHILEWTIKLEENGILGENMTFNEEESTMANKISQQINNYYGNVFHGDVSGSQVVSGDSNTVNYNTDSISNLIQEIKESLSQEAISSDDMESALELLNDISVKLEKNKKPSIIKAALVGLKDFVLDIGANVTAALITAKMQGLF